jgi:hypothetical protein
MTETAFAGALALGALRASLVRVRVAVCELARR